MKLGVFVSDTA